MASITYLKSEPVKQKRKKKRRRPKKKREKKVVPKVEVTPPPKPCTRKKRRKIKKHYKTNHANKAERIAQIFDSTTKDLSYITANPELLNEHIKFINKSRIIFKGSKARIMSRMTGVKDTRSWDFPRNFEYFEEQYEYIYIRWIHLLRCCFDKTYYAYPYFGGKGIGMSRDFMDGKIFCIWCLKNGLTRAPFMYDQYLVRADKKGRYTKLNCRVVTEKELHECPNVSFAIDQIKLIREFASAHDDSVSYPTFYTRYYMYDFDLDDARFVKNTKTRTDRFTFSPTKFYTSVATKDSCTLSVFLSRVHASYLNGGFNIKPYDLLKPEFSIASEATAQGTNSYYRKWHFDRKEKLNREAAYSTDNSTIKTTDNVYSDGEEFNVYS